MTTAFQAVYLGSNPSRRILFLITYGKFNIWLTYLTYNMNENVIVIQIIVTIFYVLAFMMYRKNNKDAGLLDDNFKYFTIIFTIISIIDILLVFKSVL